MSTASTTPPLRLRARLRSPRALRDAMSYARLTVRELAVACGNPKHRSTLAHLRAGTRNTCPPFLARRIEEALHITTPGLLFELTCSVRTEPAPMPTRRKAVAA